MLIIFTKQTLKKNCIYSVYKLWSKLVWTFKTATWHIESRYIYIYIYISVRLLSVLHGHSVVSSSPQRSMTSDFEGFPIPGTIFITFLVWRGPLLGIEPWTCRTRCQHSTTRLSRRRFLDNEIYLSSKLHVITRQIGHANMDDTGKKHDAL